MEALKEAVPIQSRITLKNILFPTDFSEASKAALPYAQAVARLYGSTISVAHVVSPEPPLGVPMDTLPMTVDPGWLNAKKHMDEFLAEGWPADIRREIRLQRGDLWSAVSGMIEKDAIDLLVLGSHGRHGLPKLILGSEAEQLYRQAGCPVLTVGPRVQQAGKRPWKISRIVYATDLSRTATHALPYALSLAEENQAALIFVHALTLIPWQEQRVLEEETRQKLQRLMPEDAAAWCRPEFVVCFDYPVEGILDLAAEHKADLIVMGVKRFSGSGWSGHIPWSTASEIVGRAKCPVLTVRA